MRINSIQFHNLQPFANARLEFPESISRGNLGEVHILAGPNGTGKSRLLSLLAASTTDGLPPKLERFPKGIEMSFAKTADGADLVARISSEGNLLCSVETSDASFLGFAFSGALQIQRADLEILKSPVSIEQTERLSFNSWILGNTTQRIANLKVQAAMEVMNGVPELDGRSQVLVRRLESAITEISGKRFALIVQAHPTPQVLFQWGEKALPIEGLPAGLNSIMVWMFSASTIMDAVYPESLDPLNEEAFFFLDEPETYLHPKWQRQVIPMAQRLFPNSQFFVATHSPFVVSSVNEGYIYKLIPDENGEVTISEAIPASKGDSYITAVAEILGLNEWFDPESEKLLADFREERDAALKGSAEAESKARSLAETISIRSEELANIIGMELRQLDRQLEKLTASAKS